MPARLGVGVIGVGTIGRRHAENLAGRIPDTRLVAVADTRADVAKAVAADLDVPAWFTTADELAAHPDVEAILIASSHQAHLEGILAAARHRKNTLCEKPITTTLAEADQAIAAVAQSGIGLQIGFMRRFDPAYVAAKQRIDAGEIGDPVLFKAVHRNASLPPSFVGSDTGVFVDTNIHDYDNARWLMGDEVTEVHAVATSVLEPHRPDDLAVSTLRFARGGLGSIDAYLTCAYAYDIRTEVAGTKGTIFIGGLRDPACTVATAAGISYHAVDHWLVRFGEAYLREVEDWARRTLAGEPPTVTAADGRAALEIATAAAQSAKENRVVHLPFAS